MEFAFAITNASYSQLIKLNDLKVRDTNYDELDIADVEIHRFWLVTDLHDERSFLGVHGLEIWH